MIIVQIEQVNRMSCFFNSAEYWRNWNGWQWNTWTRILEGSKTKYFRSRPRSSQRTACQPIALKRLSIFCRTYVDRWNIDSDVSRVQQPDFFLLILVQAKHFICSSPNSSGWVREREGPLLPSPKCACSISMSLKKGSKDTYYFLLLCCVALSVRMPCFIFFFHFSALVQRTLVILCFHICLPEKRTTGEIS